jgi:hypothetical protein
MFHGYGGIGRERGVFLLKLCWDGGKGEMTACVSKNALEASTGICSARFDSGKISIEFVIGLKNNVFESWHAYESGTGYVRSLKDGEGTAVEEVRHEVHDMGRHALHQRECGRRKEAG